MTWTTPATRSTGDLITAAIWNQDVVDNLITVHDRVGMVWVMPGHKSAGGAYSYKVGDFFYARLSSTTADTTQGVLYAPGDFSSLVGLYVLISANVAGSAYYTCLTDYGADGEAPATHSGALTDQYWAATTNLTLIDISAAVSSLAAGDFIGVSFEKGSTAWVTTTTIYVHGFLLLFNRN